MYYSKHQTQIKAIITFKINPNLQMQCIKNRTVVLPGAKSTCCFTACLSHGPVESLLVLQLISTLTHSETTLSPGHSVIWFLSKAFKIPCDFAQGGYKNLLILKWWLGHIMQLNLLIKSGGLLLQKSGLFKENTGETFKRTAADQSLD